MWGTLFVPLLAYLVYLWRSHDPQTGVRVFSLSLDFDFLLAAMFRRLDWPGA